MTTPTSEAVAARHRGGEVMWRARSASDKSDDWPYWYVTNDSPADYNKTLDALEQITGKRPIGLPFVSRAQAIEIAKIMNAAQRQESRP